MVFNELREAIVTRLKEAMPKEVDVAGHPGVIDAAELGRLCMAAPALRAVSYTHLTLPTIRLV